MVVHTIFVGSSYETGKRIALHRPSLSTEASSNLYDTIQTRCSDVPISTHFISTKNTDWKSVTDKDSFFSDIEVTEYVEDFMCKITSVQTLTGLDVAKYILSKLKSSTHLKLQKLTYLAFAEYLVKENEILFDDKIFAFQYGPVVESVYEQFKRRRSIDINELDDFSTSRDLYESDASRILYSYQGSKKISVIDLTIDKYSVLSASELVDLTHKKGTPWEKIYKGERYKEIPLEYIKKYHVFEQI